MSSKYLCLTIRFLQPYSHGRGETGEPEWPPSPLRFYQALVAAAAARWNERTQLEFAKPSLAWFGGLVNPTIIAAAGVKATVPYRLYVPDNVGDKVANSWRIGNDADISSYRTEKDVRPTHLSGDATVHYLYSLPDACSDLDQHLDILRYAARSITHLGWGIDMVAGNAEVLNERQVAELAGERWESSASGSGTGLRVPVEGTLAALAERHEKFLGRLSQDGFRPVPPLTKFKVVQYRRASDPHSRPYMVFHLINPDEGRPGEKPFSYPHQKFIHIAAMLRHLAIDAMSRDKPRGTPDNWVDTYVAGHAKPGITEHPRFSYIPLPSIGHAHTDPSIRRVMITAPPGDERWLEFLAARLVGCQLQPLEGTMLPKPPILDLPRNQAVVGKYIGASNIWASVTPVILPGHNDHSSSKTQKLIEKSLAQAGLEVPCEYEWRAVSWFPKSLTAHKYDRQKNLINYIRPEHLLNFSAVHMRITFQNGLKFPGPLAIGAGRHCGFGLFAAHD